MGLALSVGILSELEGDDPEAGEILQGAFAAVNRVLEWEDLPLHSEPLECEPWSCDMYGYSGLHYLRRIASYLDSDGELPPPGDDSSADDPRLAAYFDHAAGAPVPLLTRLLRKRIEFAGGFDHLILHSDAEGFYLPIDFGSVLFPRDEPEVPGAMVGSAPRLLRECERLAEALEIPGHLTPESNELWEAAASQGVAEDQWAKYGIESFTCVALMEGCRRAISSGAALCFT